MKVMMFTGAVPELPSGVGDYVHEVHKALRGRLELVIVTTDSPKVRPELFDGARVHPAAKSWGTADLAAIGRLIREERPDVFHLQYPSLMGGPTNRASLSNLLPPWLKLRHRGIPLVLTTHEFGERRVRWRARALCNVFLSDAVITITSKDAEILRRWHRNVRRVPLVSNIPGQPRPARAPGRSLVAFFGLLDRMKGVERFIDVAERLGAGRYAYVVIGGFDPAGNAYHASLLDRVKSKGLEGAFRFPGHVGREEVGALLAGSDCCLLPFDEGVSERRTSLLAALVQGTPVVTTAGPYVPADYRGIPGLAIVPKDDLSGMAARVAELCERGPRPGEFEPLLRGMSHQSLGDGHLEAYRSVLRGGIPARKSASPHGAAEDWVGP